MSHDRILLIAGPHALDHELVARAAAHRPRQVAVLMEADGHAPDWSDRLAALMTALERATGATVVGLLGAADRLDPTEFDAVLGGPELRHAA